MKVLVVSVSGAPEPLAPTGEAPAVPASFSTSPVLAQTPAQSPFAALVAPAASAASAAVPAPTDAPPPPATQVAAAFVALAAARPGQMQPVVIRLAPAELGHVQVRIERSTDGPAHIVLAVERTDTLMLLMQDRPQLDTALTAAGISPEGRTLQFSLSGGSAGGGSSGAGSGGSSGGGNTGSGGGFSQGHGGGQDEQPTSLPRSAWLRAGVDITA